MMDSLIKWKKATKLADDDIFFWWRNIGRAECSLCREFKDCEGCPLDDSEDSVPTCAKEWFQILQAERAHASVSPHKYISREEFIVIFKENAEALYQRILAFYMEFRKEGVG